MINQHSKPMNQHIDNLLAITLGTAGGLLQFHHTSQPYEWAKFLEGGLTALAYGFLGMAGKQLYTYVKTFYKEYKKQKNSES